jgi:hypothetical protein
MALKRLGLLGALAILPAVAQVSDASAKAALLNAFRLRHGPIRIVVERADGSVESTNWSGYAVTGSKFTDAKGSWIQPAITCNSISDTELSAFWVGLDGYGNSTVEQTGTIAGCVNGEKQYFAWYEFYPKEAAQEISTITVSPGDKISTEVSFKGIEFTLTITDETTGKTFTKKGTQKGAKRSSAEWIAEAPCCVSDNTVYPLPDFGTALFGQDSTGIASTNDATEKSHSGAFNTFPSGNVFAITMDNASTSAVEAVPSSPSSDGSSFSVQWVSP